jgi:hypothetical protein
VAKLSKRDQKRFDALRKADQALYELWKQSEVDSNEMRCINRLQVEYIHPAIRGFEAAEKGR